MDTFESIKEVSNNLISKLNRSSTKNKVVLLYAFNATGKTRLSTIIDNELGSPNEVKVISYNAYFEDLFTWNNEDYTLRFNPYNHIIQFIIEQGLENQITDNFQKLIRSKIFPRYKLSSGFIEFSFLPGDDRSEDNIKISRGEESLFVWSVFHTFLESAILALDSPEEDRETTLFNNLEYIIIDDPVSSIDDTKIITMALELVDIISKANNKLKFLITTHHALFFNVLHNEFNTSKKCKLDSFLFSKYGTEFNISHQSDTPFAYHLVVKEDIQKAINDNDVKKYHFNLFRGLLEKTATFLGYRHWSECLEERNKKEIMRLVNLYSHGRLSDLESNDFPNEHRDLFEESFQIFAQRFK